jgi:hypothetical protein
MSWRWQCQDAAGAPADDAAAAAGLGPYDHPAQGEAETWLGEHWRELLAAGVEQVVLLEGDREVYGPMSLRP